MGEFDLYSMASLIPALVVGFTFHEFAHAWMADKLGDKTARMLGRLTLDPLKHLDPIGTLMIFIAHFGWAKPVPVTLSNVRINQRAADLLISLAGPVANIIIAFISLIILYATQPILTDIPAAILSEMVQLNIILGVFNLLPIPPLDGGALIMNLWPGRRPMFLYYLEQYGTLILLLLIFTNVFNAILWPAVNFVGGLLSVVAAPLGVALQVLL